MSPTSSTFRFKIRATNNAGYTDSQPLSVVLSAVPDTPTVGPYSDASVTDNTKIKVLYGPQASANDGGSEILSYELQMDNGDGGNFTSLIGGTSYSLATTYTVT